MLIKRFRGALPWLALAAFTVLALWGVLARAPLVYGDVPLTDPGTNPVNLFYSWGESSLGTNIRLSPSAFRDALLQLLAPDSRSYFILQYLLPLMLLPFCYYLLLRRLGVSPWVSVLGGMASVANPVVFGDFLNGQTFWVYLVLPWVIFFTYKIFFLRQVKFTNPLALGLLLFASYAFLPPLIVPLAALEALLAITFFILSDQKATVASALRAGAQGALAVLIFILLIAPYLLIVPSGQSAYSPSSVMADYYHNYSRTSLLNTLRMAGNQGNGQSTLGFNLPSITNIFGYVLFAIMLYALWRAREGRSRGRFALSLAAVLFIGLGFLQAMTVSLDFGTAVFSSDWIVATIRNPTKIFVLLIPLYILLLSLALATLATRLTKTRAIAAWVGVVAILLIYNWPVLRGDLGLLHKRDARAETYQPDETIDRIVMESEGSLGRGILIPATHRDELNFEARSHHLSTYRLGGSLPDSTILLQAIQRSFNNTGSSFFSLLGMANVSDLYLKHDENSYKPTFFGLFNSGLGYKSARDYLVQHGLIEDRGKGFSKFSVGNSAPVITAPTSLKSIKNYDDPLQAAAIYSESAAVVTEPQSVYREIFEQFEVVRGAVEQSFTGAAIVSNPDVLQVQYSRQQLGSAYSLVVQVLHPVTMQPLSTVETPIAPDDSYFSIEGQKYDLTSRATRAGLRAGKHEITLGKYVPISNSITDPSFEQGSPQVSDASAGRPGVADVYGHQVGSPKEGKRAFLIGSRNHLAYFSRPLLNLAPETEYSASLSYKNIAGTPPSLSILRGQDQLLAATGRLQQNEDWSDFEIPFKTGRFIDDISINLYTDSKGKSTSENVFDALSIQKVTKRRGGQIQLAKYDDLYRETNISVPARGDEANLIDNASFEDAMLWEEVGDASISDAGTPVIKAERVSGGVDGKYALSLTGTKHIAYIAQPLTNADPNKVYDISFFYRQAEGAPPSFAVVEEGGKVLLSDTLDATHGWTEYSSTFLLSPSVKNVKLYFYAPSRGKTSRAQFDNVKVFGRSALDSYVKKIGRAARDPDLKIDDVTRINSTMYSANFSGSEGLVLFAQSFHPHWRAFMVAKGERPQGIFEYLTLRKPGKEIDSNSHVLVNGYANGWILDSRNTAFTSGGKIVIEYWPQRYFFASLAISVLALLIIATVTLVKRIRRKPSPGPALSETNDKPAQRPKRRRVVRLG